METKIVGVLRPFDIQQKFYVLNGDEKVAEATPSLDEVGDLVLHFSTYYSANKVDLAGPKPFVEGVVHRIRQAESAKYSENKLEINII